MYNSKDIEKQILDFEGIIITLGNNLLYNKSWSDVFSKPLTTNSVIDTLKTRVIIFQIITVRGCIGCDQTI